MRMLTRLFALLRSAVATASRPVRRRRNGSSRSSSSRDTGRTGTGGFRGDRGTRRAGGRRDRKRRG